MDCLRTAIRSGAREAICTYRRDLRHPWQPPGIASRGGRRALSVSHQSNRAHRQWRRSRCGSALSRMGLGEPDAKGRRKPRPILGSEFTVPVDVVLVAYGFDAVQIFAAGNSDKIDLNEWGGVIVNTNEMTSVPGIFAGGDLVRGPVFGRAGGER